MTPAQYTSMLDELWKLSSARARMAVPQTRIGRRPMSVDTLLRKEKDGTLFKKESAAEGDFKLQGHTTVQGLPIAIENRKGSIRRGTDTDGHEWETRFKYDYGYIKGTEGKDGEEIDAYVGPDKDAPNAYVIHQRKATGKGYDEDKVMLGFPNERAASRAFLAHYDDKKFLGPITTLTVDELKTRLAAKRRHEKLANDRTVMQKRLERLHARRGEVPTRGGEEDAAPKLEVGHEQRATIAAEDAVSSSHR